MRIRFGITDIKEVREVYIIPGGFPDGDEKNKYKDMTCGVWFVINDDEEYGDMYGEFDCKGATTMEECESVAIPFMDELYENGCIDISTEEKCKKYGLSIH